MKKELKPKKCKACGEEYTPWNSLQKACSPACALVFVKQEERKQKEKQARREKKEFYENDRSWQLKKCQQDFNKYIRLRDKGQPCISCGKSTGCKMNAGHFKTVGAHPHLRFEPDNCHLQCEKCNNYLSGNAGEYEKRLIEKIGQDRVDWLNGPHDPKNWTIEQIKEIRHHYKCLIRELENDQD